MSIDTDYAVLRSVLSEHGPAGWAIEFGVYSGYSLRIIAEHMPVIGLDSFEGLPEDWRPDFPKGRFSLEGKPRLGDNLIPPALAMIVPGLFEHTVPMLAEHGLPALGLVHIDCDLYSSTVTALEGVLPYISAGTYVVFDEFQGYPGHEEHEAKAWFEFVKKYGVTAEAIARGPEEQAFLIHDIADRFAW